MALLKGKSVFGGLASGPALMSKIPMNFTASFTKPKNIFPWWRSKIQDRHHDLFNRNVKGCVLIFPAAIGSTYTGMVLLELMYQGCAPAAVIVQNIDPLLVSGPVLADIWFRRGIPIVEYSEEDIYEKISDNDWIEVNGATGEIEIRK
jgi:predicted aconitase with swiveling domain